jgi:predicted dehydrogenase
MSPSRSTLSTPAEALAKKSKHRVGIVGCGRMGQYFAEVYKAMPDTEIVAIAEWNPERRPVVGERFGVKALYRDVEAMLKEIVPDIVAVVTPTKFMKQAVIASAEAGVKGVSTDKPIAARLSDADEMVEACRKRGVVFAGGNLQRAIWQVQEAARRLRSGEWGDPVGASVHGFGGEISGGGCQHLSVLRLFAAAEVEEVMAWGSPLEALAPEKDDLDLRINGLFRLSSGLECPVFGMKTPYSGVQLWNENALVRWNWSAPQIFEGRDPKGVRKELDPQYDPFPWREFLDRTKGTVPSKETTPWYGDDYLVSSIRSFLDAVEKGSELWISGHDLRQALEIAIACKLSAQLGNVPVRLPLRDRSLTLLPKPYRWLGGDVTGRPQSPEEAAGKKF